MKLFKRKPKEQSYLALDIGSEYVKALVFNLKEDKINIIGYGKHAYPHSVIQEGVIKDIEQVVDNCELAITQASLQAGIRPAETVMGISGEQVKGFMTVVQFERSNSKEKINTKEMNNIIEKVQKTAYENSLKRFKQEIGNEDLEIKLVNAALTHIMIDGERVVDPIGFRGKKMQVGVFNVYTPLVQLSNLQKIATNLGLEIMSVVAEPYTLAEAIIPDDDLDFEAVIIDVGGSTTDVTIVQHQDVVATKMFSLGGQCVTTEIATAFDIPYEEAEELKQKYAAKEIEDEKQLKKIKKAIKYALDFWQTGLEVILHEFSELEYLPSSILLAGGGSLLPEIEELIKETAAKKRLHFAKDVEISTLSVQRFEHIADQLGTLDTAQEVTPLSLAVMVIDLVADEGGFDVAMKKGADV